MSLASVQVHLQNQKCIYVFFWICECLFTENVNVQMEVFVGKSTNMNK